MHEKMAYTVASFCKSAGISRAMLYKLWDQGRGPERVKVGTRTLITVDSAREWLEKLGGEQDCSKAA